MLKLEEQLRILEQHPLTVRTKVRGTSTTPIVDVTIRLPAFRDRLGRYLYVPTRERHVTIRCRRDGRTVTVVKGAGNLAVHSDCYYMFTPHIYVYRLGHAKGIIGACGFGNHLASKVSYGDILQGMLAFYTALEQVSDPVHQFFLSKYKKVKLPSSSA